MYKKIVKNNIITNRKLLNLLFNDRDCLFYIACFLISFNAFPFSNFGLGADKPLSVIPAVLYFLKMLLRGKLVFKSNMIKQFTIIAVLMGISLYLSLTKYYTLVGFSSAVGCWGSYIIYLGAFCSFVHNADDQKIFNMVKCIFCSLWFSLIFGILEYLLLQLHITSIYNVILPFLRDNAFLESNRIQLNFGESGDAGQLLPGLYLPVILYLNNINYHFSIWEKAMIGLNVLLLLLYGKSVSFVLVGCFALLLYYDSYLKSYKLYRYIKPVIIILILVFSSSLIFSLSSFVDEEGPIGRVARLFVNPEDAFGQDFSTATRIGLWIVTFKMFPSMFLVGTGWGNFGLVYPFYYNKIPRYFMTEEIIGKIGEQVHQTYSIISTSYTEGGILGIVWLLMFFYPMYKMIRKYPKVIPFVLVFIIIALQQMITYVFAFIMIWLLLTEPKFCKFLQGDTK